MQNIIIAAMASLLAIIPINVHAQARMNKIPVLISVDKTKETNRDILQKPRAISSGCSTTHYAKITKKTETVSVDIKIRMMGHKELNDLKLVYYVVGRDRSSRDLTLSARGETKLALKPTKTEIITTDPVDFGEFEVKYTTGAFSERNRKSGNEYYGIVVQIFEGNEDTEPVAQLFSPQSLDDKIDELITQETAKQNRDRRGRAK